MFEEYKLSQVELENVALEPREILATMMDTLKSFFSQVSINFQVNFIHFNN